jgi:hypothetical protein
MSVLKVKFGLRSLTLKQARKVIEVWKKDYNNDRLHVSLVELAPQKFIKLAGEVNYR